MRLSSTSVTSLPAASDPSTTSLECTSSWPTATTSSSTVSVNSTSSPARRSGPACTWSRCSRLRKTVTRSADTSPTRLVRRSSWVRRARSITPIASFVLLSSIPLPRSLNKWYDICYELWCQT